MAPIMNKFKPSSVFILTLGSGFLISSAAQGADLPTGAQVLHGDVKISSGDDFVLVNASSK